MNKKTSSSNNAAKMNNLSGQRTWHGIGARTALVALLGMGLVAQVQGETVLFSDTFNVSANSTDVNYQNTNGRQSGGTLGILSYAEGGSFDWCAQVGNGVVPNGLLLAAGSHALRKGYVSPNHNFTENPGTGGVFFVRFKVDPVLAVSPNQTPTLWVGLALGTSEAKRTSFVNATDGFGILFRGNGNFSAFDGSTQIGSDSTYTTDTNGFHAVEVRIVGPVDGNPWDGTNGTAIAVFDHGKSTPFFCYRKVGIGYTNNWITLIGEGNSDDSIALHGVDDLQIGTNAVVVATNLALKVDFQNTTTTGAPETQVGFFDFNEQDVIAGSATYPTAAGDVTVALSGQDTLLGGCFNRGGVVNDGNLTYAGVYKDFAFKNGTSPRSLTLTLSGAGILPRERYALTFYSYDDDAVGGTHSVSFAGGSGTTGSAGPLAYTCGQDPTSNTTYAVTGVFKSSASGTVTVTITDAFMNSSNTGVRLNAFEIVADFLPKGTMVSFF